MQTKARAFGISLCARLKEKIHNVYQGNPSGLFIPPSAKVTRVNPSDPLESARNTRVTFPRRRKNNLNEPLEIIARNTRVTFPRRRKSNPCDPLEVYLDHKGWFSAAAEN